MKYRAIIFDLDGTVVNTEVLWQKAIQKLIDVRQLSLNVQQVEQLQQEIAGASIYGSCLVIKEFLKLEELIEQLITEKKRYAMDLFHEGISFIEGFLEFYQSAKGLDLKMGIATNSDPASLELIKQQLKLEKFFREHIYDISFVNKVQKPDPAIYLHTAKKIQVKPEHCIVIEDTAHGIAAAKSAGMFCYGINTSKLCTYIIDQILW